MFRQLSEDEIADFRQWARDNFTPDMQIPSYWHPVIQEECLAIAEEAENNVNKGE